MRDATDGDMDGTRWLSYAELAEARGISKRSAIRLTFRHRWQRQKGNDGTVRVAVPMSELERRPDGTAVIDDDRGVNTHADSGIIKALAAAVLELQERAERDKVEITRERSRADAFEVQVRELLTTLSAVRDNVAQLREERATANAKADAAETRVDDLMAQVRELGEGRAEARAKAQSLQLEVNRMRTEAERLKEELAAALAKAGGRPWFRAWLRRGERRSREREERKRDD
jgi:hypothetical protein